jgi:glutaminyl-tRNA synthetase
MEHIDYSICTLEFETRREPYFWLLMALDMYRPKVYEMSRLNLEFTVLSKRRLLKLVDAKHVRGWDDPRMPTISGLRRRGYTAKALNAFCDEVGATRNMNVVEAKRLEQQARVALADEARRCMAVLDPVEVVVAGGEERELEVPDFPQAPEKGSHKVRFTPGKMFVDRSDFREEEDKNFYGISPGRLVGLKYANAKIVLEKVEKDGSGAVVRLLCKAVESDEKPKSYITWVGEDHLQAEVRKYGPFLSFAPPPPPPLTPHPPPHTHRYSHLFTAAEPTDLWEEELNPNSEEIIKTALVDPSVAALCDAGRINKWESGSMFQFERIGYYVVDYDTTYDAGKGSGQIVLNSIVGLKEDVAKKADSKGEEKKGGGGSADATRLKQEKQKARLAVPLEDFFRKIEDYQGLFSKFDDKGIPTHDKDGEELKKNAVKKLMKDHAKHAKALASAAKQAAK